ncbi:MAG: histidine triad nucleotide-binding protein [Candidatus Nomurabacteria bacterium]|nr:MAG: histidine triad nucleotide-binding protein [Candidatus Nomurabacteria bacterium]
MSDCIFCKIVQGELPSEALYQDDELMVIRDVYPKARIHILAIPKTHIESLATLGDGQDALLGKLLDVLRRTAAKEGIAESGYKVVMNVGQDGGQSVPHLHIHLLGGERVAGIT